MAPHEAKLAWGPRSGSQRQREVCNTLTIKVLSPLGVWCHVVAAWWQSVPSRFTSSDIVAGCEDRRILASATHLAWDVAVGPQQWSGGSSGACGSAPNGKETGQAGAHTSKGRKPAGR